MSENHNVLVILVSIIILFNSMMHHINDTCVSNSPDYNLATRLLTLLQHAQKLAIWSRCFLATCSTVCRAHWGAEWCVTCDMVLIGHLRFLMWGQPEVPGPATRPFHATTYNSNSFTKGYKIIIYSIRHEVASWKRNLSITFVVITSKSVHFQYDYSRTSDKGPFK